MPAKPDRHNWNEVNRYLHIHRAHLEFAMDRGILLSHNLDQFVVDPVSDEIVLAGRVVFHHGMFLDVAKQLEIMDRNGRTYVRTRRYNYQAMIVGDEPRPVFRYDNAHAYPGHADDHHKHCVNYEDWTYIEPPQWVGHDNWPVLSEVIDELHQWWLDTGWRLQP